MSFMTQQHIKRVKKQEEIILVKNLQLSMNLLYKNVYLVFKPVYSNKHSRQALKIFIFVLTLNFSRNRWIYRCFLRKGNRPFEFYLTTYTVVWPCTSFLNGKMSYIWLTSLHHVNINLICKLKLFYILETYLLQHPASYAFILFIREVLLHN